MSIKYPRAPACSSVTEFKPFEMFTKVLLFALLGVSLVLASPATKSGLSAKVLEAIEDAEKDIVELVHQFANFEKDVVRKIEQVKDEALAELKDLKNSAGKIILGVNIKILKIVKRVENRISELVASAKGLNDRAIEAIKKAENRIVKLVSKLANANKRVVKIIEEVRDKALAKLKDLKHTVIDKPLAVFFKIVPIIRFIEKMILKQATSKLFRS